MSDSTLLSVKKARSAAYPGFTLDEVIEAGQILRAQLGNGPYSRESAAHALGYSGITGSSSTKIAACVHFGILVRDGNAYRQSELANQIYNYVTNEERASAIKEAFLRPALYARLVSAFDGKAIPAMLDNVLVRQYGIQERAAKDAANTFRKSAEYAGVLINGVLTTMQDSEGQVSSGSTPEETYKGGQIVQVPALPLSRGAVSQAEGGAVTVVIPGTQVAILFPVDLAYDLSIGSFKDGIEKLAENIKAVLPQHGDQATASVESVI